MRPIALLFLLVCCAGPARAQSASPPVVLNEVLYDVPGADGGAQFVELFNREERVIALTGYRLEAGDGAGEARWKLLWTGQAGDVILPRGRFVIGEGNVLPRPDRVLAIDLENGPDAVRLSAPDGKSDVLGYGALTFAGYFEGRPCEDVAAGYALARAPDGADTGDNRADFVALSPATPGTPNVAERDLALVRVTADAERVEPGDPVTLRGHLLNRGVGALSAPMIEVLLWAAPRALETGTTAGQDDASPAPDSLVARLEAPADLDPGDSLAVVLSFIPGVAGAWDLALQARVEDDGAPANDRAAVRVQVGPGALIVNEVLSAPRDGPEWIELRNVSREPIALFDWTLEDATGRRGIVVAPGNTGLAFDVRPDSLVVLTSDPPALLARHPELSRSKVAACQPWPTLNNGGAGGEPADRVVVRAPSGRVSDAMELPGGDPIGASLERRAAGSPSRARATWGVSAAEGGTPGQANSIDGGAFVPGVALVAAAGGARPAEGQGALLSYRTGFERATVSLAVYDLRGRLVRALLENADGPGQARIAWDGRAAGGAAAAPGVYVAGLKAKDTVGGAATARARAWVWVR